MQSRVLVQTPKDTGFIARAGVLLLVAAFVLIQAVQTSAQGLPNSFADLAARVSPSVVNITSTTVVAGRTDGPQNIVPDGSPFEDFFKEFQDRQNRGDRAPRRSSALGSGFVISEDGYIVTNNHVIEGADEIVIEFFSGDELPAKLIGTDANTDLALLKVEVEQPLPFVSFGDSDISRVGDWVIAVGNPLGQGFSVSAGIVSARGRALSGAYDDYIQTDAAINKGNSGGPLFNMDGDVIGVNTAILSPNGGSIGLGFSMASNVVARVIDQIEKFGEVRRGWLGVSIQDVSEDLVDTIDGLDEAKGAIVSEVRDGPSKEAGILVNDVILAFNGEDIEDTRDLVQTVGRSNVDETVKVVLLRDGRTETINVTLGLRPEEAALRSAAPTEGDGDTQELKLLGMTLRLIDDAAREALNVPSGINGVAVMEIDEGSEAFAKGLRVGDVITEAGQEEITALTDLGDRVEAAQDAGRKSMLLLVRRDGDPRFVALPIE